MKKISLLLGALGGGLAGYLFSNGKLREELVNVKDPKKAAKVLGKHLSADGDKLARDVKEFLESAQVQGGIQSAKKYASEQYKRAKSEIEKLAGVAAVQAPPEAHKARRRIAQKVRTIKKG